jgi:hypothetical protein
MQMKTFMLTYPLGEKNEILFETAVNEKEAVKKFRDRLGRKLLPWKSEVTALRIDGHRIEKEQKVDKRKYFRWSETDIIEMFKKFSVMSLGRANEEFIKNFVSDYRDSLNNK